jgi:hypothetical protein
MELFFAAETEDQLNHWASAKRRYLDIYSALKSYFGGSAPFPLCSDDLREQEITELMRDDYLALYALIHQGWSVLSPSFKKIDYPLDSPGEALIEIISLECICYLSIAFPDLAPGTKDDFLFSPQTLYRLRSQYQKLQQSSKLPNRRFMEKFKKHFGYQAQWGYILRDLCVHLVEAETKGKKSTLRRKLVEYRKINALMWERMFSKWHPRKNPSGCHWVDGQKFS